MKKKKKKRGFAETKTRSLRRGERGLRINLQKQETNAE